MQTDGVTLRIIEKWNIWWTFTNPNSPTNGILKTDLPELPTGDEIFEALKRSFKYKEKNMSKKTYLNMMVSSISSLSLSREVVPSTRTEFTLSRKFWLEATDWYLSFNISKILGCLKNATTLSLYAVGMLTVKATMLDGCGLGGTIGAWEKNYKKINFIAN